MTTCNVCGKVFGSSSGDVCSSCRKLLDIVYEKACAYLRDNPKKGPNAAELAEALGEDRRLVDILILEGKFEEGDSPGTEEIELERRRKKLLADLQKSISLSDVKNQPTTTYGNDRHGKSDL
ncbi:MAG: hypothetical protein LBI74_02715 [Synergistaceae bacterium]|nr:hypothetical protein [Synergistaceae bacterium]